MRTRFARVGGAAVGVLVLGVLGAAALVSTGRLPLGGRHTGISDRSTGAPAAPPGSAGEVAGSATRGESAPVPAVPHRLVVISHPAGAELRIVRSDGSVHAAGTPFR